MNDDEILNMREMVEALNDASYRISQQHMKRLVKIGKAPPYERVNPQLLRFTWGDVLKWANARTVPDRDTYKTRVEIAELLTEAGYKISRNTLSMYASYGCGPPFARYGIHAYYRIDEALAWARNRWAEKKNPRHGEP